MFLDFSVMHEGNNIDDFIKILESAIVVRECVEFDYTNTQDHTSGKSVEPIALTYKWYAWYLLGFCHTYHDYRWYKVIRMRNIVETKQSFTIQHESSDMIMKRLDETENIKYIDITLKCDSKIKVQVEEYLKGKILSEEEDYFILLLRVPEYERMWFSLLLSFGKSVEVLEPISVQRRLKNAAKEIVELYE